MMKENGPQRREEGAEAFSAHLARALRAGLFQDLLDSAPTVLTTAWQVLVRGLPGAGRVSRGGCLAQEQEGTDMRASGRPGCRTESFFPDLVVQQEVSVEEIKVGCRRGARPCGCRCGRAIDVQASLAEDCPPRCRLQSNLDMRDSAFRGGVVRIRFYDGQRRLFPFESRYPRRRCPRSRTAILVGDASAAPLERQRRQSRPESTGRWRLGGRTRGRVGRRSLVCRGRRQLPAQRRRRVWDRSLCR